MSLRTIHLVFIVASLALAAGGTTWSYQAYKAGSGAAYLTSALLAAVGTIALFVYGIVFLRKVRTR